LFRLISVSGFISSILQLYVLTIWNLKRKVCAIFWRMSSFRGTMPIAS